MSKWLLLPISAFFLSCTHGVTQDASATRVGALPYASANLVRYANNDRAPAQDGSAKWSTRTLAWNITHKGGQLEPQLAKVEQVVETPSTEDFLEDDDILVWEGFSPATCSDFDCGTLEASGESPYWSQFISSGSRAKKAAALENAIRGLGLPAAKALTDGGFFKSKPRTWLAFTTELARAEKAKVISKKVYNEAVFENREDNIVALGYANSAEQCRPVPVACEKWEQKWVRQKIKKQKQVISRRVLKSVDREVYVNVVDPQLQPWEVDQLYIKVGNDPKDVTVSSEGPTVYKTQMSVQGAKTLIQINGVDRKKLELPEDIVRKNGERFVQVDSDAVFTLSVDPKYVPATGTSDRLELEYRVQWCQPSWTGRCNPLKSMNETPQKRTVIGANGQATVRASLPTGARAKVTYSLVRVGSKWYGEKPTAPRETETIRIR